MTKFGKRGNTRAAVVATALVLLAAMTGACGARSVETRNAGAVPIAIDLGTLGGPSPSSSAKGVSGNIIVGDSRPLGDTDTGQRAFAYDLGAASPKMRDLGTLGGTFSEAQAVSGNIVVGTSSTPAGMTQAHAFAYDLGAASPKMRDLGAFPVSPDPRWPPHQM